MRVSVIDAWKVLYEGNADEVRLPGEDGELCVLDFHHPFLYRLREGYIQLREGKRRKVAAETSSSEPTMASRILIHDGIARMASNELVILVQTRPSTGKRSV